MSPISISDIFFSSAISQISFLIHLMIPSTSSGAILTLNLKLTSLISWTSDVELDTAVILPITPLEERTGRFFETPSLDPLLIIIDDMLAVTPLEMTSAPTKSRFSLLLKFKNSLYLIFSVSCTLST